MSAVKVMKVINPLGITMAQPAIVDTRSIIAARFLDTKVILQMDISSNISCRGDLNDPSMVILRYSGLQDELKASGVFVPKKGPRGNTTYFNRNYMDDPKPSFVQAVKRGVQIVRKILPCFDKR